MHKENCIRTLRKKIMKIDLKINTEFPIKTDDTLYDHLRPHVLSWISDQKTNHTVFLREHIPMNITAKLGSN
jgi:hypothetical protein